ncbi:MAG: lysophospholipid acyltransferase family protein [Candidatus Hydrogenedens sp.]|nr:lysophospholipid acyltransferase family protein [Candidatus Hydrogenedens sp.]
MVKARTGKVNIILCLGARFILWCLGWKAQGPPPPYPKYVAIFAPHTSNWDGIVGILCTFALRVRGNWLGKGSLFKGVFGWFLKKIGGIPVERSSPHRLVEVAVELFNNNDNFVLGIAPEGTRFFSDHWKSGFYQIAYQAKVPIVLGFWDYRTKRVGNSGIAFIPTGNVEEDLKIIRETYDKFLPKYPEHRSIIQFKDFSKDKPKET